ncbi:phosphotyrosine-specific ptp2-like protein [Microsporum audouinii]
MSTTAATSRPSPAWGSAARISTTPAGLPPSTPPSAGQITASFFANSAFSSRALDEPASSGYFDLVANTTPSPDTAQLFHPSRDRDFALGIQSSAGAVPKLVTPRKNADGLLDRRFAGRPGRSDERDPSASLLQSFNPKLHQKGPYRPAYHVNPTLLEDSSSGGSTPMASSPSATRHGHHASAPVASLLSPGLPGDRHQKQPLSFHRPRTIPISHDLGNVKMIPAEKCLEILQSFGSETLLLDVRPLLQFNRSHIKGSLNLCIPTTLLKRPSFNLQKVEETFGSGQEKSNFNRWRLSNRIMVYDSSASHPKDATLLVNLLEKFTREGWNGESIILSGGFARFAAEFPDWVESSQPPTAVSSSSAASYGKSPLSISLTLPTTTPSIAGGCAMPTPSSNPVNPFFSNIRQNIDLIGGVGQLPVTIPPGMDEATRKSLPAWLSRVADSDDAGKTAAIQFLKIEKGEQSRMQQALSAPGTSTLVEGQSPGKRSFRIAGIEKGSKNRYNNIYPYDHCRVKIQDTTESTCDYINASYVCSSRSNKRYIATQAPMPATFNDFWRVVWEQDTRLIVMLTAETDGAQVKCHPYWKSADYGNLRVQLVSEGTIPLDRESGLKPLHDTTCFTVRHFSITNSKEPFKPPREVTQIQYADWPDFGTPAKPHHLLRLIEECDAIVNASTGRSASYHQDKPDSAGQGKVIVHCSAGCGRTGTFCTVDSVIDMLKRQRKAAQSSTRTEPSWVYEDTTDLVATTVEDFRSQRLSMVQSLRQFVLCYDSVLEWLASRTQR